MITTRAFKALLIPSGVPIMIIEGTTFEITQFKGGTATIYVEGNLVRVSKKDLDAIGIKEEEKRNTVKQNANNLKSNDYYTVVYGDTYNDTCNSINPNTKGQIDIELVWKALRMCYDPEIPVNIVELGLVYGCHITDHKVLVDLTLTAPMCGMGPVLIEDIKERIMEVPYVLEVETNMVFDPPWTMDRLSEAAKIELGLI